MLLAEYDYDTDIAVQRKEAREEGIKYGIAIGEKRGRNEGISIGLSQGITQGVHQKAVETAKTLLTFGDSIEKVSKVTGLSVEEIEKLSDSLN